MPIAKCFQGMDINRLPVQVVTRSASQGGVFANLSDARRVYPTLDPAVNGKDFTWACYGEVAPHPRFDQGVPTGRYDRNKVVCLRFEDWGSNDVLSN